MKTYIYKLILKDRLFVEENWTKEDEDILNRHVENYQRMIREGTLLLAGKTAGLDENTYGVCIFKAETLEEAIAIMNNDPAIKEGIMDGYLHEYNIAFLNKDFTY